MCVLGVYFKVDLLDVWEKNIEIKFVFFLLILIEYKREIYRVVGVYLLW